MTNQFLGSVRMATQTLAADYTLVQGDGNKVFVVDSSTARTITISADSTTDFPISTKFTFIKQGTGNVTIVSPSGSFTIIDRYAHCVATKIAANTYLFESNQTPSFLLNTYTGAAAAYSLRKLRSAYTGACIRVRRTVNPAEMDIGFDTNGNLNTVQLLNFVGSGNGFVTTWYDQSGNTNNATETTGTAQPQIVSNGSVIYDSVQNIAGLRFDGIGQQLGVPDNATLDLNQHSFFAVLSAFTGGNTGNVPFAKRSSAEYSYDFAISRATGNSFYGINSNVNRPSVIFNFIGAGSVLHYGNYDQINISLAYNSTSTVNVASVDAVTNSSVPFFIGRRGAGFNTSDTGHFLGLITELILYSSEQSANRAAIETNINNYYNIY